MARTSQDISNELERLNRMAQRFDALFRIPGTRIRLGLDSILGLLPGIGDAAALAPAAYMVWKSHQLGARPGTLARMGANVGIDALLGSVPLIGDLFDIGFKANLRNVALLEQDLADQGKTAALQAPAE